MKKIFLCIAICLVAVFGAQASDKEQIAGLIDTIKNAPEGSITLSESSEKDNCEGHIFVSKDDSPLFYGYDCSRVVGEPGYYLSLYTDDGSFDKIMQVYSDDVKELLSVVEESQKKENNMKTNMLKTIFSNSCGTYGFDVLSETNKDITVKYYSGPENKEFVFSKIFDEDGVKVYWGGDKDVFVNNNSKWKNYGHRCTTEMEYKTVTQQCGKSGKIKIVWYQEKRDPYILADLAADADPWGFSDVMLVYKLKCDDGGQCKQADKTPLVFLREGQGNSFKNADMTIRYGEFDGGVKWKIDSKLCKSIPDCLKSEADLWGEWGVDIEYIGRYSGKIDGYTDVDVYGLAFEKEKPNPDISSTYNVRPRFWAVHGDKLVRELDFDEGVDVLKTIRSSKNIPDAVKKAAKSLTDRGFDLVYVGRYPGEFDGYTDVDIYHVSTPAGTDTGFPILYAVRGDKIIRNISGFKSLDVLKTVLEKDSDPQTSVKLKPESGKKKIDMHEAEKNVNETCDTGFEIQPGFRKWMVVKYNDEPADEDHMYLRILDNKNMKVYYGGDGNTFVNKDDKWTIYGPRCKGIKQQSFIHECDAEHKIKIVWYEDPNSETHFANDFILVHRMQCDKNGICENIDDGYPIVFVFDKVGFPKSGEKVPYGTMVRAAMGDIFKNRDLVIWHGTSGINTWNIDNKLCKFGGALSVASPKVDKNTDEPVYVEKGLSCKSVDNKSVDVRLYPDYAVMSVDGQDIKLDKKKIKSKDSVEYSNSDNKLNVVMRPWLAVDAPLGGYKDGEARPRGSILNFFLNEKFCKRNLSSGDNGLIDDETKQKLQVIFE